MVVVSEGDWHHILNLIEVAGEELESILDLIMELLMTLRKSERGKTNVPDLRAEGDWGEEGDDPVHAQLIGIKEGLLLPEFQHGSFLLFLLLFSLLLITSLFDLILFLGLKVFELELFLRG